MWVRREASGSPWEEAKGSAEKDRPIAPAPGQALSST